MSQVDCLLTTPRETSRQPAREIPISSVSKVQVIRSIDEWKAQKINFKNLRPAVLQGDKLLVFATQTNNWNQLTHPYLILYFYSLTLVPIHITSAALPAGSKKPGNPTGSREGLAIVFCAEMEVLGDMRPDKERSTIVKPSKRWPKHQNKM